MQISYKISYAYYIYIINHVNYIYVIKHIVFRLLGTK